MDDGGDCYYEEDALNLASHRGFFRYNVAAKSKRIYPMQRGQVWTDI